MTDNIFDPAKLTDPDRLRALAQTRLIDTPREESFDRLTRLVSRLLDAPVSLVSLVDRDRQFFKSAHGLEEPLASERQTPLSHSFCQHVVTSGTALVIEDAKDHPVVCHNPAVTEFGVGAYAGVPITSPDGHVLGSLCALDMKPRHWGADDLNNLHDIAKIVTSEIMLRQEIGQRMDAEKQQELLIGELHHRVKNVLASAGAIVQLSMKTAESIEDYRDVVSARIMALANTQDLLTAKQWKAANLKDILRAELKPYEDASKIEFDGPGILLPAQQAALFGMTVHELTTNAAKYGALSAENGQIKIRWSATPRAKGQLWSFDWAENGGPAPAAPKRKGFGTDLIERLVKHEKRGKVEMKYPPEGAQVHIEFLVGGV
jgi:two-component sensor histidine kinase